MADNISGAANGMNLQSLRNRRYDMSCKRTKAYVMAGAVYSLTYVMCSLLIHRSSCFAKALSYLGGLTCCLKIFNFNY